MLLIVITMMRMIVLLIVITMMRMIVLLIVITMMRKNFFITSCIKMLNHVDIKGSKTWYIVMLTCTNWQYMVIWKNTNVKKKILTLSSNCCLLMFGVSNLNVYLKVYCYATFIQLFTFRLVSSFITILNVLYKIFPKNHDYLFINSQAW